MSWFTNILSSFIFPNLTKIPTVETVEKVDLVVKPPPPKKTNLISFNDVNEILFSDNRGTSIHLHAKDSPVFIIESHDRNLIVTSNGSAIDLNQIESVTMYVDYIKPSGFLMGLFNLGRKAYYTPYITLKDPPKYYYDGWDNQNWFRA
jgi:hypothetical protein